jgi:hypothetical protein
VRGADALVDNLRPSSLERLGLGPEVFTAATPRLVRGSVSAYGHEGRFADLPGFDPVMQALSGLASAQGGVPPSPQQRPSTTHAQAPSPPSASSALCLHATTTLARRGSRRRWRQCPHSSSRPS